MNLAATRSIVPLRAAPLRGMATLTVVMVMFFVMAMVAAYTNRNLIFEQRTSANSFRSAQALAAAEAGVDWTVAMINGGTIDASCVGTAGGNDFRTRYLNLDFDGSFKLSTWPPLAGPNPVTPTPSCAMTDAGWNCSCPSGPVANLVASGDDAPVVFRVLLEETPSILFVAKPYPGVVSIEVRGCTSAVSGQGVDVNDQSACHKLATAVDGKAVVRVALGLVSALPVPPAATVTAAKAITFEPGTTVHASNADPNTATVLHAGGAVTKTGATVQYSGPAGGDSDTSNLELSADNAMSLLADDPTNGFFRALFGMLPQDYQQQPATFQLNCAAATCSGADLAGALTGNPSRVIWVNGNLDIDQAAVYGSAALPAMVVVTGTVTFSQPAAFNGVIYSVGDMSWGASSGSVVGALITKGNFAATAGTATLVYDREIIRRIRQSYGSFVRVPGSWRIKL